MEHTQVMKINKIVLRSGREYPFEEHNGKRINWRWEYYGEAHFLDMIVDGEYELTVNVLDISFIEYKKEIK